MTNFEIMLSIFITVYVCIGLKIRLTFRVKIENIKLKYCDKDIINLLVTHTNIISFDKYNSLKKPLCFYKQIYINTKCFATKYTTNFY